jgi:hypothetical protein
MHNYAGKQYLGPRFCVKFESSTNVIQDLLALLKSPCVIFTYMKFMFKMSYILLMQLPASTTTNFQGTF